MKAKHICILYPYQYLPYSSTVLNLYDELSKHFRVTILCCHGKQEKGDLEQRNVVIVSQDHPIRRKLREVAVQFVKILKLLGLYTDYSRLSREEIALIVEVKAVLKRIVPDEIIAVDTKMLWLSQAVSHKPAHLLSLELASAERLESVDRGRIGSVVIESRQRLEYLFPREDVHPFFVPVSPIYRPLTKPRTAAGDLLYCGSAHAGGGIYSCMHLITRYPDLRLTIKGRVSRWIFENIVMCYPQLLDDKRLIIDRDYTAERDMAEYVSGFRIGFCLYDTRFEHMNTFHVRTINSQKLYRYFSGGVPVIANRLEGLNAVESYSSGILIDDLSPKAIYSAIERIEQSYDSYVSNALEAAMALSFDRHILPFIDYLRKR